MHTLLQRQADLHVLACDYTSLPSFGQESPSAVLHKSHLTVFN
jgi:hypothetical protein